MGMGKMRESFLEDEKEWRLPSLLCTDDLVIWRIGIRSEYKGGTFC